MNKYAAQSKAVSNGIEETRFKQCARKRAYSSEEVARADHPQQRAYKCLFCDDWHLSGGVPKVLQRLRPKKKQLASTAPHGNAKYILVCLVSGWELRHYLFAHGTSQWRLVNLSSGAIAPQSGQVCDSIGKELLYTDSVMHDGAYQTYFLTPSGRKKANKLKAKK